MKPTSSASCSTSNCRPPELAAPQKKRPVLRRSLFCTSGYHQLCPFCCHLFWPPTSGRAILALDAAAASGLAIRVKPAASGTPGQPLQRPGGPGSGRPHPARCHSRPGETVPRLGPAHPRRGPTLTVSAGEPANADSAGRRPTAGSNQDQESLAATGWPGLPDPDRNGDHPPHHPHPQGQKRLLPRWRKLAADHR